MSGDFPKLAHTCMQVGIQILFPFSERISGPDVNSSLEKKTEFNSESIIFFEPHLH